MKRRKASQDHTPRRLSELQGQAATNLARMLRARYDAAQTTDDNRRHWASSDGLSADAALSPAVRRTLRNRSRYECANNTYARGLSKTLADDLIGTGPHLQLQTGNDEWNAAVEESFSRWARRIRLTRKLRTMRMAKFRDGETFATFTNNMLLDHWVKMDLRLYEAEQIANPYTGELGLYSLTDGIVYDDFGNVLAYNVLRYHPGDTSYTGNPLDVETIPARNMVHWFDQDRPIQSRGCVECAAGLPLFAHMRRYTLAVLAAAETAADVAAFLETMASPEDPDDLEPLDAIDFEKRMLMTLPKGWKMSQLKAEQPATTYGMFKREIVGEIGRERSVPYNVAAGDSSSYNYASGRLDHKTYYRALRVETHDCEDIVLEPIFEHWWEEARLADQDIPAELRASRRPPKHSWNWDGDEHVDPVKEAVAQQTRLESGTTTRTREYASDGLDVNEEDAKAAAEYGVTVEEYRRALFQARFGGAKAQVAVDPLQPDDFEDEEVADEAA